MYETIEKIIDLGEPDDEDRIKAIHLFDALQWDNYPTNYEGEELDSGDYGDDAREYTVMVPKHQMHIFEYLEELGVW